MRRRYLYAFLAFIVFAATAAYSTNAGSVAPPSASSVVKIIVSDGHGSAVHIGGGSFLTSTHVVEGKKTVSLKTSDGKSLGAKVLWTNKEYEIAMLGANGAGIASSALSCREAAVGEPIRAVGNPLGLEFISSWGHISGSPRESEPLKSAYVTDITTVMGMSGGPTFDRDNNIIGITVAAQTAMLGEGRTLTGFGFVVPSKVVCMLLGRAA
ncbi:serine protease [Sinorhizobium meliloti]|uniref:S1 family peptidase n=1 Tax=Rhizobium meliloti TaxID=382 RepID=UPI000FD28146|nr:serine protease [Sinorhizobium meliloti]RVO41378.1 serine protease [Sinorhizobium meliloti]